MRKFTIFKTVFKKEFKSLFRGGQSLIFSLLVPILMMPFLLTLLLSVEKNIIKEIKSPKLTVFVVDGDTEINILSDLETYKDEYNFINDVILGPITPKYIPTDDVIQSFYKEEINLALYFDADFLEKIDEGAFNIKLIYNASYTSGLAHSESMEMILTAFKDGLIDYRLKKNLGSSLEEINPINVTTFPLQDSYPLVKKQGLNSAFLIMFVPTIIIGFISFGSSAASAELFSLEKEKNTLESLLSTSANRKIILFAKITVGAIFSIVSSLGNFLSIVLSYYLNHDMVSNGSIYFKGDAIFWLFLSLTSLSLFTAILNCTVYIYSKSNKNAAAVNSLLLMIPMTLSFLVGSISPAQIPFWSIFVPFIGTVLSAKMAFVGYISILNLVISSSVNILLIVSLLWFSKKRFLSEKVLQYD